MKRRVGDGKLLVIIRMTVSGISDRISALASSSPAQLAAVSALSATIGVQNTRNHHLRPSSSSYTRTYVHTNLYSAKNRENESEALAQDD